MGIGVPSAQGMPNDEEQGGGGGGDAHVRNGRNLPKAASDSANVEDDSPLTLEEQAKQALDCPCVADLVNGPCGKEFKTAFGCFIISQRPEKGSDCVKPFDKMKLCMIENAKEFISVDPSDPSVPPTEGRHRLPTKEEDDRKEAEKEAGEGPPIVPKNVIRLPIYLTREMKKMEKKEKVEKIEIQESK